MISAPTGTITFLFANIEGSTPLWERYPDQMREAVARHDSLIAQSIEQNNGFLAKTTGDGALAAFTVAPDALAAALDAQILLQKEPWSSNAVALRTRMSLHTGIAEFREGDYFGQTLNRAARLMGAAHGGQVLLSEVTHELCRDHLPPDIMLASLGEHRLKDLARPEHIYQAKHPLLRSGFPPLRTLDIIPNNLPQQLTSFIGREKNIVEIQNLLGKTRLLTLTGAGGSGKTRLSLQVAADALEQYPDGIWQIELAPLSDASLLPQVVASALELREQSGKEMLQTLTAALKSKKLLLILDNCEHLLAACTQFSASILRAGPQITILATSREPLGIGGEITYRVPPLSLPDTRRSSEMTAAGANQYEAVRLFIDRALLVKSEFTVTNDNASALSQLCYQLDGIPLAIELAAARVRALSVEQINDRLDSRFRLLTGGDRSALPRQQTLRALIDWSYDLLGEQEKILFARLSVFAGGFELESVEQVCGFDPIEDWEVLDLLASLTDKSLILADDDGAGSKRYRILESLRQYASEKQDAGDDVFELRQRLIACYVALAEAAEPFMHGPEQARWMDRLEREHDNLRFALNLCERIAHQTLEGTEESRYDSIRNGLRISGALGRFWLVRGYFNEGHGYLSRALEFRHLLLDRVEALNGNAIKKEIAHALHMAGLMTSWYPLRHLAARTLYEESLSLAREIDNKFKIASILYSLGVSTGHLKTPVAAQPYYEESLSLCLETGNKRGAALAFIGLGNIASNQNERKRQFGESLTLYRELEDRAGMALALGNIGLVTSYQGDYETAWRLHSERLDLCRQIGYKRSIGAALRNLGMLELERGHYGPARPLFDEALGLFQEIDDERAVALTLGNLGTLAGCEGDFETAWNLLTTGLARLRGSGDNTDIAIALDDMGFIASLQGDDTRARPFYAESLALQVEAGRWMGFASPLEGMAATLTQEGDPVREVMLWAAAESLREASGLPQVPNRRPLKESRIASLRAAISPVEFADAWEKGRTLSADETVRIAFGHN